MISFVRGVLSDVQDGMVEIDTGLMGFMVNVPATVLDHLPARGEEVKLYTYFHVKEDEMSLYGFDDKDALHMFKLLISVSGIGPKGALAILSVLSPADLRFAILSGDAKAVSKAPGVGAKTAQRLCLELKDKVSLEDGLTSLANSGNETRSGRSENSSEKSDAILALTALGYGNSEVLKAVSGIDTQDKSSEQIIKEALKLLF